MLLRLTAAEAGTRPNRFELCSSVDARLTEEARRKPDTLLQNRKSSFTVLRRFLARKKLSGEPR
jgi:hypothetical protein